MKRTLVIGAGLLAWIVSTLPVAAHTEPDLVAVPSSSEATLTLRPTHGCGDSPTVRLGIRAPVEEATAGEVDGWTASAEPDGEGNTVLIWSDGLLPANQEGAFPVIFTVPDAVGSLLLFPAVQVCENEEELAWISGDPGSDFPAPRILVLPEGYQPAASIDEVPADAPGRDQLVKIVDTDRTTSSTTTTTTTTTTSAPPETTTTAPALSGDEEPVEEAVGPVEEGAGFGPLIWIALALVATAGAGALILRRARS